MKITALALLLALPALAADPTPEQTAFFEKNIRPVLADACYKCHSAEAQKRKGGLTLDTREATLRGGESGKAGVVPGKPMASSVYEAMTWANEDMQMPPKQKLPDHVLADFKKWIEMGAPDPRNAPMLADAPKSKIDVAKGREHWAFKKPVKQEPPTPQNTAWARDAIDKYVLADMESKGLTPVADADRRTLIRRIAFDLTGLPPTPDEINAFLGDSSPNAVKNVIELYLDSPRFGERWGRHWLDVARYAESSGKEVNLLYPHAWRYRDYVIESFNKDKPYDQFLREQIAGDLLKYQDKRQQAEQIVATGFLAIGAKSHNQRDARQFRMDVVDEQIDAVSQSMLGLTIACARCHDHKFDPVAQRDYYALAGIFLSTETLYGTHRQLQNNHPSDLIELDDDAGLTPALAKISQAEVAILKKRATEADAARQEALSTVMELRRKSGKNDPAADFQRIRQAQDRATQSEGDAKLFRDDGTPRTLVMGTFDKAPTNAPIMLRGDPNQATSTVVPRGLVEVLCAEGEPLNIGQGSGRLDLAWWIASKDNPLTARVMANRLWLHLFGQGIVQTPDNFGTKGMPPTNQALLDHLALRLVDNGWSLKRTIKEIMLSRTYQLSSQNNAKNYAIDPDNHSHWRMSKRRLDAEAIRDSMFAVAGTLNLYPVDGSPVARAGDGRQGLINLMNEVMSDPQTYRSVFLPILRDQIPESLALFDFPDASLVAGQRDSTNVPSQSLYLMNNPQAVAAADAFARRLGAMEVKNPQDRFTKAYELAYGRPPTAEEGQAVKVFFQRFTDQYLKGKASPDARKQAQGVALSAFCQSLFGSAEFRYLN